MEKNDLYFVPINEVAKRLDVPAHTLRYWEKQFPGALKPTTGAAGRRYYRPEVVEKIATIKTLLYDRGMTIAGVKKMIHNGEFSHVDNKLTDDIIENFVPEKLNVEQTVVEKSENVDTDKIDTAIDLLKSALDLL